MSIVADPDPSQILLGARFQVAENCPAPVREKIETLARTEDCRFSPAGRKLAIAGYAKNAIVVFDVEMDLGGSAPQIVLSDYVELTSDEFDFPHGLDFVDESTLVIGNRGGSVVAIALPEAPAQKQVCVDPLVTVTRADFFHRLNSPGSVSVARASADSYDLMVCNNYTHRVTGHTIARGEKHRITRNRIVFDKGLKVPDGVAISQNKAMVAISNHLTHEVFLYPNDTKNRRNTKPAGLLKGLDFPHGLRFFNDDKHLLVADAGLPFMRLYHSADGAWRGEHMPVKTIRIMDDALFLKGHYYHQEGGLKGLDFSPCQRILATTCEMQPLVFYDAARMFAA